MSAIFKHIYFNYFIKTVLCIGLYYGLWYQLEHKQHADDILVFLKQNLTLKHSKYIVLVVMLTFVNWGIEAVKWRMLAKPIQQIGFLKALFAVLSGVTFSIFTPNRIGEYAGRILFIEQGKKIKGIASTLVGSLGQLIASFALSSIGFVYFLMVYIKPAEVWIQVALFSIVFVLICMIAIYYEVRIVYPVLLRVRYIRKYAHYFKFLKHFSWRALLFINVLSAVRFIIFSVQYVLLIKMLQPDMVFSQSLLAVFAVFFLQTITPSVALLELPMRGNIAVYIWGFLQVNFVVSLASTFLLWMLNIVIPALIGMIIILSINIVKSFDKNEKLD